MSDLIVFENASKTFSTPNGPIEASRDINLTVKRGEFVTLVGPSGCGKSTLLNMTAGIFAPTTGKVLYDGKPVDGFNGHVGYMTQNDHLLTWRTVGGNIGVPLEIAGLSKSERKARVEELAEMVGLSKFLDSYPSQLSGGMRKRCALARLLAYSPETLLLDEPFAALDAQLRLRMQMELRSIVQTLGKTVLFVTHDLDEAVAIADRCAIFTRGPGTIRNVLDIPLGKERELIGMRHNPDYVELTATLWDEMAPDIRLEEAV
ncbi:ABC transporter ATP-binding protein [Celeribacter litoreus]|uniref:ABC transporter ATP-binding protein n=1 Tax=Celeribacter litoreus TaxID=2876714 RepID=UPI001CCCF629|nr:ABC transporter ATP-binding protein [Celeribacter litoreus]MCA0042004.1 ABC transporter ATP-binding protein [Celeribacter litoreus]